MNVYGATTHHILDIDYLSVDNRKFFGFKPSINGWHTSVNMWESSTAALGEANRFLARVEAQINELFPFIEGMKVETGKVHRLAGVVVHERLLMWRSPNGLWEVFAKCTVAYGPECAIDAWDRAEEQQWFHHSMV